MLSRRSRAVAWGAASLLCAAAALRLDARGIGAPLVPLGFWLISIALFLAAARELDDAPATRPKLDRDERLLLAALVLVALAVRLVSLASAPWPFGGDESEQAFVARAILDGRVRSAFRTVWLSQPTLFPLLEALSMGLVGDSTLGARLPAALVGAATVPALYLFARRIAGSGTAALAACLLAVYHVHVALSRVSMFNIADPLVALAALTALLHALQTGSARAFAAAGIALGLALHGHPGQRLSWVLAAAAVAHHVVFARPRLSRLARGLSLSALGFAVAAGPLAAEFLAHPAEFNGRLAMSGIFRWIPVWRAAGRTVPEIVWERLRAGFGAYTSVPDRSPFYDPGMPLLDPFSSVLFLIGVVRAALRPRDAGWFVLVAWVAGAAFLGGSLMASAPDSPRYLTVLPAVCLLVAVGACAAAGIVARLVRVPRATPYLASALVGAVVAWNLSFYFRRYLPHDRYAGRNNQDAMLIAELLRTEPPGRRFELLAAPRLFAGYGTLRFLAPLHPGHDAPAIRSAADVAPAPLHARAPLFVAAAERARELEIVRERLPGGRMLALSRRGGAPAVFVYDPPPRAP